MQDPLEEFESLEVEFVDFVGDGDDPVIVSKCPEYVCTSDYGSACDGKPYSGS